MSFSFLKGLMPSGSVRCPSRDGKKHQVGSDRNVAVTSTPQYQGSSSVHNKHAPHPDKPPDYSRIGAEDHAFEKLSEYDTIFLVDDSSSMSVDIESGGNTRWKQARLALEEFVEVAAKYDTDGTDIHFINYAWSGQGVKDPREVAALFPVRPFGTTNIGARLCELLNYSYFQQMELASREKAPWPKRRNYMIITDGEATDSNYLRYFLRQTAQTLTRLRAPQAQIGFQFFQIGNDPNATRFLEELDGDNQQLPTDIVDTFKAETNQQFDITVLRKALLGGINRNFDRKY